MKEEQRIHWRFRRKWGTWRKGYKNKKQMNSWKRRRSVGVKREEENEKM